MPTAPDYTIELSNANATQLDVDKGKKVVWHNSTNSVISLHPPSCVTPADTLIDISAGATSRNFTITGNKGASYDYDFTVGAELGPRNGKIKVNT